MIDDKPTISLIWIGHVDHGKSTTLGHLLAQIGVIDSRTIEKLKEEAIQNQMESWQWAYVLLHPGTCNTEIRSMKYPVHLPTGLTAQSPQGYHQEWSPQFVPADRSAYAICVKCQWHLLLF